MLKKIIAMFMICAMLVPLSPVVAADETTVMPTIEEILNSYHKKAFEAQAAEENGETSTYARSCSSSFKTLEQETVDELTTAGYMAYNVTRDNYNTIEETLNTDLSAMGLDPNKSYIVVISDTPPNKNPSSNNHASSRTSGPPLYEDFDGNGSPTFTYSFEGTTYTMRYITVTATVADKQYASSAYNLSDISGLPEAVNEWAQWTISAAVDEALPVPFVSLFDLATDLMTDSNLTYLDKDSTVLFAATAWTRSYIDIFDDKTGSWHLSQYSSYAISRMRCASYQYNSSTNQPEWEEGPETTRTFYSPNYNRDLIRLNNAITAFTIHQMSTDRTGNIYFNISEIDTLPGGIQHSLFGHYEWAGYYVPPQ